MTEEIFRQAPYERRCEAEITAVAADGIELDRTVFYPHGGGQPGDSGYIERAAGEPVRIVDTRYGATAGSIVHRPATDLEACEPPLRIGERVTAVIDWERRYRLMRMHTCMHVLSAVVPAPVTGGGLSDGKGRLDLNLPDAPPDKEWITAELQRLIREDHPVRMRWIDDAELETQPELIKTMSVRPPQGTGQVRLIDIDGVDLQPCGGTHVASTGEIGGVRVRKIESKGKQNRRISLELTD